MIFFTSCPCGGTHSGNGERGFPQYRKAHATIKTIIRNSVPSPLYHKRGVLICRIVPPLRPTAAHIAGNWGSALRPACSFFSWCCSYRWSCVFFFNEAFCYWASWPATAPVTHEGTVGWATLVTQSLLALMQWCWSGNFIDWAVSWQIWPAQVVSTPGTAQASSIYYVPCCVQWGVISKTGSFIGWFPFYFLSHS